MFWVRNFICYSNNIHSNSIFTQSNNIFLSRLFFCWYYWFYTANHLFKFIHFINSYTLRTCSDKYSFKHYHTASNFFLMNYLTSYLQSMCLLNFYFLIKRVSFQLFTKKNPNKLQQILFVTYKKLMEWLFFKIKKFLLRLYKFFNIISFLETFFFLLLTKDSSILVAWLKSNILFIPFNRHGAFFKFLSYFIDVYGSALFSKFNIVGLKLSISGKISATGSSKKKTHVILYGLRSFSQKTLKVNQHIDQLWTFQGSLGLKVFLFFN